jgi:oxepin-CoA hydrolase/3-oxo-5,6-dehydrosuberyl-CoA semialdehyde dehydrogenase
VILDGGLASRLTDVIVGDPASAGTVMGPVASLSQRDEVRAAIGRLSVSTKLVFGDPTKVEVVGADHEPPTRRNRSPGAEG